MYQSEKCDKIFTNLNLSIAENLRTLLLFIQTEYQNKIQIIFLLSDKSHTWTSFTLNFHVMFKTFIY